MNTNSSSKYYPSGASFFLEPTLSMRLPDLEPPSQQRRIHIHSQEKSAASSVISSGCRRHKPTNRHSLDNLLDTDHDDPFNKQAMRDLRANLRSKLDAARALGDPERTKVDVKRLIQLTTRFMLLTDPELAAAAAAAASGEEGSAALAAHQVASATIGLQQQQQQTAGKAVAATPVMLLKARRMSRVGGFAGQQHTCTTNSNGSSHIDNPSPLKTPNWTQDQAHSKFMSAIASCVSHATPREMQTDALRKHRNPFYSAGPSHGQDTAADGLTAEHEASTVVHVLDSKGQVRTIARYAATVDQVRQSQAVAAIAARRAARGGATPEDHSSLQKQLKPSKKDSNKQGTSNNGNTLGESDSESDEANQAKEKTGSGKSSSVLASMSKYIEEMKAQDLEITKRILNQFKQGNGGPTSAISVVASLGLDGVGGSGGNGSVKSPSSKVGFDPSISSGAEHAGMAAGRRGSILPGAAVQAGSKRLPQLPTAPITSPSIPNSAPPTTNNSPLTLDPSPWGTTIPTTAISVLQRHPIERSAHDVHILAESVRHLPAFSPFVNAQQAGGSRMGTATTSRTRGGRSFSTSDTVYQLCKVANVEYFRPNQVVFKQGDSGSKWYVVLRGKVDIQVSPVGAPTARVTVANLSMGQGFGELALVNNNPRAATVVCCAVPTRHDKHGGRGPGGPGSKYRTASTTASHDLSLHVDATGTTAGEGLLDEEQATRQRPMADDLIFLTVDKMDYLRIARTIHQQELQAKIILLSQIPTLAALSAPASPNYIDTLQDEILHSSQSHPTSKRSSANNKAVDDTFNCPRSDSLPADRRRPSLGGGASSSQPANAPSRPNAVAANGSVPTEPSTGALSALQSMAAVLRWRTCATGQMLLKQGQPAGEFFFIRRGFVDVYRTVAMELGPQGELRAPQQSRGGDKGTGARAKIKMVQVKVARKGPGEYFGEEWVCKWGVSDYLSRWAKVKMEDPKTVRARFENLVLGNLNNSGASVAATALLRGNANASHSNDTGGGGRAIGEVPTFPSSITARVAGNRRSGVKQGKKRRGAATDSVGRADGSVSDGDDGEATDWDDDEEDEDDESDDDDQMRNRAPRSSVHARKQRTASPLKIPPWADPNDMAVYEKCIGPINSGMNPGIGAELAVMTIFDGQTRMKGALPLSNYLTWDDDKLRAKWFEAQEKKRWRSTRRNVLKELRVKVRRGDGVGGKVVLGEESEEVDVGRRRRAGGKKGNTLGSVQARSKR